MTGESLRNPSPELVEGARLLSPTVAYASGSERKRGTSGLKSAFD